MLGLRSEEAAELIHRGGEKRGPRLRAQPAEQREGTHAGEEDLQRDVVGEQAREVVRAEPVTGQRSQKRARVEQARVDESEDRSATVRVGLPQGQLTAPDGGGHEGGEREMNRAEVPGKEEAAQEQNVPVEDRHFQE